MKYVNKKVILISFLFVFAISGLYINTNMATASLSHNSKNKSNCSSESPLSSGFNFGMMLESNGQEFLFAIAEDHYELGKIKGTHLALEYLTFDAVVKQFIMSFNVSIDLCYYLATIYNNFIPEQYKQELIGISEVTGISYMDLLLQVLLFDIYYGQLIPQMTGFPQPPQIGACTIIAGNNRGRSTTIGQNMDLSYAFKDTINFVYYKIKGQKPVFSMNMGAMHLIGKTRDITSTLNLISTIVVGQFGMPTAIKRRLALETCDDVFEHQELMVNNQFCASWNWVTSDRRGRMIATESIPATYNEQIIERRDFVVSSNTYKTPQYQPFLIDPTFSLERQAKAEELTAEAMKNGRLSIWEVREILSYYDGTEASICRPPGLDPTDPIMTSTVGSMISKGRVCVFSKGLTMETSMGFIFI